MTVGELVEQLRRLDAEREVFLSMTSEEFELVDAPLVRVGFMAGHVFLCTDDE